MGLLKGEQVQQSHSSHLERTCLWHYQPAMRRVFATAVLCIFDCLIRVVIATVAFRMVIDCPDIHQIYSFGSR